MNNKDFNYENLDLTVKLLSDEDSDIKTKNIPCKIIKLNDEDTTLNCITEEKISASIDDSFSNLGKDNLIVNLKDNENSIIIFDSDKKSNINTIIAIVIPCVIILISISIIILIKCKSKPETDEIDLPEKITEKKDIKSHDKNNCKSSENNI